MHKKYFFGVIVFLLIFIYACALQQQPEQAVASKVTSQETNKGKVAENAVSQQVKNPSLKIISPKEGDLIKNSTLTMVLQAENFELVPVGQKVKDGQGHFHVWLDNDKKLGPETTFTFENVVSGKHSIVAELVRSDHSSLNPKVTQTIAINVESDYAPKLGQTAQGENVDDFTVEADDNGFYPNKLQAKVGDKVIIHFKFRDSSIYFAGLDLKGPFPTIQYRLRGEQPLNAEFTIKDETKITSYWPASGVKKSDLIVEVSK